MIRKLVPALVVVASLAACGADDQRAGHGPSPASEPHRPATADERLLARRYVAFARAVAHRGDAKRVDGVRIPDDVRHLTVARKPRVFAFTDRAVPGTIQLSSPSIRRPGSGALIVFFTRQAHGWRVTRVLLGGYG